ncbi:hypothetical protein [Nocardiopsis ansamitocini]|uniref:Cytochrome P450 n=1 Tax=Nocardiopsis ansamitocini TaxID=1670832 RepID=A0A9W6PAP5_9ACTN|nr:hypothetical protein [Nocardiopsis ansamitocini]GLU50062.1 cytochrome P450 [Nocardiopsis ansamitocini]
MNQNAESSVSKDLDSPLHQNAVPMPDFSKGGDPADFVEGLRATFGPLAPVLFEDDVAAWLVLDYEALSQVLGDHVDFPRASGKWTEQVEGRFRPGMAIHPMFSDRGGLNALCLDGAKHERRREAIDWALRVLTPKRVTTDAARLANNAIDAFSERGQADLVADFAAVVPGLILNRWFGMTEQEFGQVVQSMTEQWNAGADSTQAQQRLVKHGTKVAAAKRAALAKGEVGPHDDLIAALISAPQGLSDIEIAFDLELLIGAAFEPVKNLTASVLRLLLTDHAARAEVASAYTPVEAAIDQALWRDPPIAAMPGRFPTKDVEVAGQPVRAGEGLVPCYLAANRDPKLGSHQLDSVNQAYLSFGKGVHACPARDTGRGIVTSAIWALLRRLPDVRLAVPAEEITLGPSLYSRGPQSLPVTFTPVTPRETTGEQQWDASPTSSTPAPSTSRPKPASSESSGRSSLFSFLQGWWSGR